MVSESPGIQPSAVMTPNPEIQTLQTEMREMCVQLSSFVEHASQRFEFIETSQNQFQTHLDDVKDANRKLDFIILSMGLSQRADSTPVTPSPATKNTDQ